MPREKPLQDSELRLLLSVMFARVRHVSRGPLFTHHREILEDRDHGSVRRRSWRVELRDRRERRPRGGQGGAHGEECWNYQADRVIARVRNNEPQRRGG